MSSGFVEVMFGDHIETIQALSVVEVGDTLESEYSATPNPDMPQLWIPVDMTFGEETVMTK